MNTHNIFTLIAIFSFYMNVSCANAQDDFNQKNEYTSGFTPQEIKIEEKTDYWYFDRIWCREGDYPFDSHYDVNRIPFVHVSCFFD